MIGADFIVEYLSRKGVKHIFTYAGGTNAPLLNSIYQNKKIMYIPTRHEQNAAIAAVGYSLTSETLGVALSMSGPGATNMTTGIADAWFDSIPVLFITGQVTRSTYKFDNPSRQMGYQETDIVSIIKSITKKATMITDIRELPDILNKYITEATTGRPGPVLIDVPMDIQQVSQIDEKELNILSKPVNKPPISRDIINLCSDKILKSKRPLIIAGGGINNRTSKRLLTQLVETFKIPVVTSLNGKSAFPNESPFYWGFIGAYGNRYANIAMANCDLLIAIGTRLDSRQTSDNRFFARGAFKIHVDIDKNELNNNIKSDLIVHAEANDFMTALISTQKAPFIRSDDSWSEYFYKLKVDFNLFTDVKGTDKNVNPKKFLHALSSLNDTETVYLADVGNNQMFAAQSMVIKENQKFLVSGGLGTMGFALPAAVGAYFASPQSQIIAITGDGGFQMAMQELQTMKHFNLPIKIIVLNNDILGLMKVFQDEIYGGVHCATVDGYSTPDISKIAHAFDFNFKRVTTTDEAISFIPEFLSIEESLILEVIIHKDWTCYPKNKRGYPVEYQEPSIPDDVFEKYMLIPVFKKA